MKTEVYVVGFDPIEDRASVGGFDWYPDRDVAIGKAVTAMCSSNGKYITWMRTHDTDHNVNSPEGRDAITNEIERLIQEHGSDGDWN